MNLTEAQSRELFRRTGNYLKEACDRCRKAIAEVRYTRRSESGKWCSKLCRDCEQLIAQKRKGGCPTKYRDAKQRSEANARYQREFRHSQDVRKTPSQLTGTKRLADAVFADTTDTLIRHREAR